MPEFYKWIIENVGINFDEPKPKQDDMQIDAPKNINHEFFKAIEGSYSRRSFEKWERIMHSHGASLREVF